MTTNRDEGWLRFLLIAALVPTCWLAMQLVHEAGHVLAGWATGAVVERVVLHPLTISRTEFAGNPRPLVVGWAGPLCGVLVPLAIWLGARRAGWSTTHLLRFLAGFCLVANGAYLGSGAATGIGDAGDLLRSGSPTWPLLAFALLTVPLGLALWHRQGRHFGLGPHARPIPPVHAAGMVVLLTVLVVAESLWSGR